LLPDGAEVPTVGAAYGVAGTKIHNPVSLNAEEKASLILIGIDPHVLLEFEFLLPDEGDGLPAASVTRTRVPTVTILKPNSSG
jgi:hypothetical protein